MSVTSAIGGGGGNWDLWSTFGTTWPILGLSFGAQWISEGRSAGRFSMCLALPQKNKQKHVNYTAEVGEAKYIEKRQADGPSWFLLASFWRPLDVGGPIRLVFLEVFGATRANATHMYTLTADR